MSHVNYLVFLKNTQTQEEFTAPTVAAKGAHDLAVQNIQKQYPTPQFQIHTAYSEEELKNALQSFDRWPGLNASIDRTVSAPKDQKIAPMKISPAGIAPAKVSLTDAVKQATGAQIEKVKSQPVQTSKAPQPKQPEKVAVETAPAEMIAQPSKMSVIEQLKALRQQS